MDTALEDMAVPCPYDDLLGLLALLTPVQYRQGA
jgi:hypothetical protein